MRAPCLLLTVLLSACGASSTLPDGGTAEILPPGGTLLDLELLKPTLCPECRDDGDLRHVLLADLDAVGLDEAGGTVRVGLHFQRWYLKMMCDVMGCITVFDKKPQYACFHVQGGKVTATTAEADCPPPPQATFPRVVADADQVEALVGPGQQGGPVTGHGVVLPSGDALVDLTATLKPAAQLGGFADPAFTGTIPLVSVGNDAGVYLLPAPEGVPMAPAMSGPAGSTYWHDRSDGVYALDTQGGALLARPVRGAFPGLGSATRQVLETPSRVLTVTQVNSHRGTTSGNKVFAPVLVDSAPLKGTPAPLVPFAPLWARAPDATSVVLCFNRPLESASSVTATAAPGPTLEPARDGPSSQCVTFPTAPQDRGLRQVLTVTAARATTGEALTARFQVSVPPYDPPADGGVR